MSISESDYKNTTRVVSDILPKYPVNQLKTILRGWSATQKFTIKAISKLRKKEVINLLREHKYDVALLPEIIKAPPRITTTNVLKRFGKKAFTEPEQEEFQKTPYEVENPLVAKGKYHNPKTHNDEELQLQAHQKSFVEHFYFSQTRGAICFHGVGTGKTITAVVSAHYYLQLHPTGKVILVSPPSLIINFIEGLRQYGLNIQDSRFVYYSFEQFSRGFTNGKIRISNPNTLIIVDEAHILRTEMRIERKGDEAGNVWYSSATNKRGYAVLEGIKKCHKCILLTATPFINQLYDIENLVAMCNKIDPIRKQDFYEVVNNVLTRNDYFKYKISYYQKSTTSEYFPTKIAEYVPLVMNKEEQVKYEQIARGNVDTVGEIENFYMNPEIDDKGMTAFYNAERQVGNLLESLKFKFMSDRMKKPQTTGKFIIYTTFLNNGMKKISRMLENLDLRFSIISGNQNSDQKENAKNRYNKGEVDVLLITKAGTEGIDTVGTEAIFIVEGSSWNEALVEQAIARAIRFKSHYHLPKEHQKVWVYRLLVCKPTDVELIEQINKNVIADYATLIEKWKHADKELKEKHHKVDPEHTQFDKKEMRKLEGQAKIDYLAKLKFNRYAVEREMAKYDTQKPSIEVKLTVMSRAKQQLINDFIEEIEHHKILGLDDYDISKYKHKELVTMKEINDMLTQQKETINDKLNDKDSKLVYLMNKLEARNKKMRDKMDTVKRNQSFYTPIKIVEKMLKRSSKLKSMKDNLDILEPSAGIGNLIVPIFEMKKNHKIHMCEIDPEARKVLTELCQDAEGLCTLYTQGNFLKFMNPIQYDLVVMNPPFHLRKANFTYLPKDVFDMDFVYRAFHMLKKGGELIALVKASNARKPEWKEFLKDASLEYFEKTKWIDDAEKGKGTLATIDKIELCIIHMNRNEIDVKEEQKATEMVISKKEATEAKELMKDGGHLKTEIKGATESKDNKEDERFFDADLYDIEQYEEQQRSKKEAERIEADRRFETEQQEKKKNEKEKTLKERRNKKDEEFENKHRDYIPEYNAYYKEIQKHNSVVLNHNYDNKNGSNKLKYKPLKKFPEWIKSKFRKDPNKLWERVAKKVEINKQNIAKRKAEKEANEKYRT